MWSTHRSNVLDLGGFPPRSGPHGNFLGVADHLIQKALKEKGLNNPEIVAEVGRRLEAGKTVTVEALAEEMTEESGKLSACGSPEWQAATGVGAVSVDTALAETRKQLEAAAVVIDAESPAVGTRPT